MTSAGWIFLTLSLAFVWSLTLWCYFKVLSIEDDPRDAARPPDGSRRA